MTLVSPLAITLAVTNLYTALQDKTKKFMELLEKTQNEKCIKKENVNYSAH